MSKPIVIIGGGGHAKVAASIIRKTGLYTIIGYTDLVPGSGMLGLSYLGDDSILESLIKDSSEVINAHIGLGMIRPTAKREMLYAQAYQLGFSFPPIVSPQAIVNEDVTIGNGSLIVDGVVINTGARIGTCAIINTSCSIDHDTQVGDFTHIAPGVTISGDTKVGNNCLVGAGAVIIQGISIADNTLIGAGAVVIRSITEPGTYAGNPARRIK